MLLLVPDLLSFFQLLFVVNGSKVIAHILGLLGILDGHLGLRVHVRSVDLEIIKIHIVALPSI